MSDELPGQRFYSRLQPPEHILRYREVMRLLEGAEPRLGNMGC